MPGANSEPLGNQIASIPVTADAATWAYRFLLGRNPESQDVLKGLLNLPSCEALRRSIIGSIEFQSILMRELAKAPSNPIVRCQLSDGLFLYVDLRDRHVSFECLNETYEEKETRYLIQTLQPNDCFIDVGASIGWFTCKASKRVGAGGTVYSFEPAKQAFVLLSQAVTDNCLKNVVLDERALWSHQAHLELQWESDGDNLGHAFVQRVGAPPTFTCTSRQSVSTVALDDVGISVPIKFIKLDVEGAEYEVLCGAKRTLQKDRPIIASEIFASQLQTVSGVTADEYVSRIIELGYDMYVFSSSANAPEPQRLSEPRAYANAHAIFNAVFLPL